MKGIFIPQEFFEVEQINYSEMIILSIYKYYTEEGKYKCCNISNQEIGDIIKMSRRSIIKIKDHLKELGYIRTEGKKVYYAGINKVVNNSSPVVNSSSPVVNHSSPQECTTVHPKGEPQFTPKVNHSSLINVIKNNKEKKDLNKELNKDLNKAEHKETVWDLVLKELNEDNKTQDKLDYLNKEYSEKIDYLNKQNDKSETTITTIRKQIEVILQQQFSEIKEELTDQEKISNVIEMMNSYC